MFIDIAKIKIVSGKGGDGKVGFHREKYVAAGGPDGGDGGRGGSVIFKVDDNLSTLLDFRYKKKYVAAPGEPGGGKRCKGKDGADLIIRVPRGTIIRDQKTGQVMKDMSDSEPFVAAKGGNGGWGNTHFATPTRQAPRFAKPGLPGVERDIILELKLLADVGLVGFPNVGKSTLLSMVSAARPKIANYHFTTLVPNLGVVSVGDALHAVSPALRLRSDGMRFTTLDAFTLDLFSGRAENLKCGAAPTYMRLNGRWTILPGTALPIGLAEEDELGDAVPLQMNDGDIVVMLSDGVTDGTDDKWSFSAPTRKFRRIPIRGRSLRTCVRGCTRAAWTRRTAVFCASRQGRRHSTVRHFCTWLWMN